MENKLKRPVGRPAVLNPLEVYRFHVAGYSCAAIRRYYERRGIKVTRQAVSLCLTNYCMMTGNPMRHGVGEIDE